MSTTISYNLLIILADRIFGLSKHIAKYIKHRLAKYIQHHLVNYIKRHLAKYI